VCCLCPLRPRCLAPGIVAPAQPVLSPSVNPARDGGPDELSNHSAQVRRHIAQRSRGTKCPPNSSWCRMNPAAASPPTAPAPVPPARPAPPRDRDRELVRYVGRHGLVRIAHVMKAMEAGRTVTYDRVATCVEAGLLERLELVRSEPGLLRATRDGLRFAGLGLPVAKVSPGGVDHMLRCATTARLLDKHYKGARVLSEREFGPRRADRRQGDRHRRRGGTPRPGPSGRAPSRRSTTSARRVRRARQWSAPWPRCALSSSSRSETRCRDEGAGPWLGSSPSRSPASP
jgi:hypothetical protein